MEPIRYSPYTAAEISPGVWSIEQDFVRSYLIIGRKRALLIDTCDADADLPGMAAQITPLPVMVVQTHCDQDHIGSSHRFPQIYMHPSEFSLLRETGPASLSPLPVREGEPPAGGNSHSGAYSRQHCPAGLSGKAPFQRRQRKRRHCIHVWPRARSGGVYRQPGAPLRHAEPFRCHPSLPWDHANILPVDSRFDRRRKAALRRKTNGRKR